MNQDQISTKEEANISSDDNTNDPLTRTSTNQEISKNNQMKSGEKEVIDRLQYLQLDPDKLETEADYARMRERVEYWDQKYAALQDEYKAIRAKYSTLDAKYSILKEYHTVLSGYYSGATIDYIASRAKCKQLRAQYEALRDEDQQSPKRLKMSVNESREATDQPEVEAVRTTLEAVL